MVVFSDKSGGSDHYRRANRFAKCKAQVAPVNDDSPQWWKDFMRDGWAIIKGAVPRERADKYADQAHAWLEGFNLGYKRDDPSTYLKKNLPRHDKGGLYSQYSIAHAQFVWDVKSEPGIVSIFEHIWGTDKLTVSFDGGNLAVPFPPAERGDIDVPWPHADQSPLKPDLESIQGLCNLLPNGPKDGGLVVTTGSPALFKELIEAFEHQKPADGWSAHDNIRMNDDMLKWLADKGCTVLKPSLEPGDFIIWDSRNCHYGAAPTAGNHRFAVYVCYKPDEYLSDDAREEKKELFEKGWVTSHDPITFIPKRDQEEEWNINFPYGKPKLSEKTLKAACVIPY